MNPSYRVLRDDPPEHSSKPGAAALAKRIAEYWANKGIAIDCNAVPTGCRAKGEIVFGVRSGLVFHVPKV